MAATTIIITIDEFGNETRKRIEERKLFGMALDYIRSKSITSLSSSYAINISEEDIFDEISDALCDRGYDNGTESIKAVIDYGFFDFVDFSSMIESMIDNAEEYLHESCNCPHCGASLYEDTPEIICMARTTFDDHDGCFSWENSDFDEIEGARCSSCGHNIDPDVFVNIGRSMC